MDRATLTALAFLVVLGICVSVACILILAGGKFYKKIPEKLRPRRWFVAIFFSYFVIFCLWFPVWLSDPHSVTSRVLSVAFGAFSAFIAAWVVLGRIGFILVPVIAIVERIREAYKSGS